MNLPPASLVFVIAVATSYLITVLLPDFVDLFALVPLNTLGVHFYFWNILTSALFEASLLQGVISILGAIVLASKLELKFGTQEFLTFTAFTNISANIAIFCVSYICVVTELAPWMMSQYYAGLVAAVVGWTVGYKQAFPAATVGFLPARFIPLTVVVLGVALDFMARSNPESKSLTTSGSHPAPGTRCPAVVFGAIFSWIYLRYYQRQKETGKDGSPVYGDCSDGFAFRTFFPAPIEQLVAALGGTTYTIMRALGCCADWDRRHKEHLQSIQPPDPDAHVFSDAKTAADPATVAAERRRKLALEALEARLKDVKHSAPPVGPHSGPSLEPHPSDLV
jgi:membrane associated rhomboid family serine protease